MAKTPLRKAEQSDDSRSSSKQRDRHAIVTRETQKLYYSDEHPEIPTVRRASLYQDKQMPISEPVIKSGRSRTSSPTTNTERTRKLAENKHEDEEKTLPLHTAQKIMVARRRRPTVYEPPPHTQPRSRGRHKQAQNPFLLFIHSLRQRPLLYLAIILALIFSPVVVNTVRTLSHSSSLILLNGDTSSSGIRAANPHALTITPSDTDHPAPPVFATSAYLLDADTGATLYAYNPFMHLPMLSTTKLMTVLIAAEKGNLDQKVTINDAITSDINQLSADSSLMGIKKGETYTLRDLIYGALFPSGNDAAVAIADAIGGNLPNFITVMNQRASQLGLYDTHYTNPHGLLDSGHFSCAHDLAILGKYSLSNPFIHQMTSIREYHITKSADHAEHDMFNGDQFLWWYPGADGGKPGFDGEHDFVQVVSVTRNHHHLIGTVQNTHDWWTDMRDLMNWGFDTFTWISPHDVDQQHAVIYDVDWNYFAKDKKENTIPTADHGRYYIYTGYSITGAILAYFDKNDGLKKLGYPIGLPKVQSSSTVSQPFEHATIQCSTGTKACKLL